MKRSSGFNEWSIAGWNTVAHPGGMSAESGCMLAGKARGAMREGQSVFDKILIIFC